MENYIGLDAHSATSTFVNLNHQGEIISRYHVKTTEKTLIGFIQAQKGKKSLTFEECHLSQWLYILLKDHVDELIVCNPLYLSKRSGPKNDFRDAHHLADSLRMKCLTPVFHDVTAYMEMRGLVSGYGDLVQDVTRCKNRYKSLFRSQAIQTKGVKIFSEPERISELKNPIDQFVAQGVLKQIDCFKEIKSLYLEKLEDCREKYALIRRLCTIPGISTVRAIYIASLLCSAQRFKNKHKLWAYCMLVKYSNDSDGVSYGKKKIQGRRELKYVFIGAAHSVLQHHPESSLRQYYDGLRLKGIDHSQAVFDLARRLAAISLSILKHDKPYDDNFEEKKKRRLNQKSA